MNLATEVQVYNIDAIMSPKASIKFATAAIVAITLLCYCECTTKWQNEMILDRKGDFQMFWDLAEDNITIEVQVRTKGYVAFGFSPVGGMKDADIVIGWVNNSQVILQDRFSADYVEPTIDDNQDYELISGSENDTHTIVRFTRLLETCDKQDLPIVALTMFNSTICPSECTAKSLPADGINIFAIMFHAHNTVTKIYLRHFRDGVELPLIAYTNNYDVRIQNLFHLLKEVKVMPGDILAVQCEFNTMDRTNITMGGVGTSDEMCTAAYGYYPKSDLSIILKLGPYQDILQILESASSKKTKNKSSRIPKMLPYGFVRNFNASILTKQDIYELRYIQTYGKMEGFCIDSASRVTHFTADYPNIKPISYEETSCENSSKKT